MIVRISGEDQYRLEGVDGQVNELDNAVVAAVEAGDEQRFHTAYDELLSFVRSHGTPLAEDELEGSDLILPPRRHLARRGPERVHGRGADPGLTVEG